MSSNSKEAAPLASTSPASASKKQKKSHSSTTTTSSKGGDVVGSNGGDNGVDNGGNGGRCTGVMTYLQSHLPRSSLLELYCDEMRGKYVCRAVLQCLPETSQQVIIRLSCCGGSFSRSAMAIWIKYKNPARAQKEVEELYQWAIIQEVPGSTSNDITLTEEFFQCLKTSLQTLDSSPWTALTQEQTEFLEQEATRVLGKPVKFPSMTPEDLEKYTQDQWDAVLHYLVGTPNMEVQPNPAITHFLLATNLMQPDPDYKGTDPDDAPLVITQKGYDFMLQDNAQQVWHFVMQYLKSMENHAKAQELQKEALLVLICLSYARFGECYSAASLSKDGRVILKDLALFGLLYVKKVGKTSIFYPTRIAMQLVGSNNDGDGSGSGGSGMWTLSSKALESALAHPRPHDSSHLAIITQTNFQLCAYTTSELHVSMLGLFCDVQTIRRLPNAVFMTITRDSIKAAFSLGIQAQQILRFLEKHAHPKLRQGTASPVPANIIDQIFLWDRERHRLSMDEVFMHQCVLHGEFQAVKKFAFGLDAHVWSSENRNQLFLRYKHAERVQTFVRTWRAKAAAS